MNKIIYLFPFSNLSKVCFRLLNDILLNLNSPHPKEGGDSHFTSAFIGLPYEK